MIEDTQAKPQRAAPDWERIEFDYRAGVLSLRELALAYPGTNHVQISRRAKKEGWTRSLQAKIRERADALVTQRTVTPDETARRAVTERETIESNATAIANIKLAHRGAANRGVELGMRLMAELEAGCADPELLARLGEIMANPDADGAMDKLNDAYRKATNLPGRATTYKTIIDGLKVAISMQRQSWDMDGEAGQARGGFEQMLSEIHGELVG